MDALIASIFAAIQAATPAPGQAEAIGQALRGGQAPATVQVQHAPSVAQEMTHQDRGGMTVTPERPAPRRRCDRGPDRLGNLNYFCR